MASRLELAYRENEELRERLERERRASRPRVVRIGAAVDDVEPTSDDGQGLPESGFVEHHGSEMGELVGSAEGSEGRGRVVLTLFGTPRSADRTETGSPNPAALAELPCAPRGPLAEGRLPVVALPGEPEPGRLARELAARVARTPAALLPPPSAYIPPAGEPVPARHAVGAPPSPPASSGSSPRGAPAAPAGDEATRAYREAVELIAARRFEAAIEALTAFLDRWPADARVESALYWRAEARYALGEYARALVEFDEVLRRSPEGPRVADLLLKIGLCHQRMGDHATARSYFERVRRRYPSSEAARVASRKDAS
jgi:tol-pal system protein YbgF